MICIEAPGGSHGFAGPVTRMLVQIGQRVEYSGFSHVGIAYQRNNRRRICCDSHAIPLLVVLTVYAPGEGVVR